MYLKIKKPSYIIDYDSFYKTKVARHGFEPRQTVPKTVVLPLYYRAIRFKWSAKIRVGDILTNIFLINRTQIIMI